MSTRKLCRELSSTDCPEIHTPVYQHCLKQVIESQDKGKRDRVMQLCEDSARLIVSNKFIFSSIGFTFTFVILMVYSLYPNAQHAPTKVQAADVIEDIELASARLQQDEIRALEEKLQMRFDDLMNEMRTAQSRMVYEMDPRVPMRVIDARGNSVETHVVFFTQDTASGNLRGQVMHMNAIPAESTQSAFGMRKVFQYSREEGNIVMLELSENNLPESSIVLAAN